MSKSIYVLGSGNSQLCAYDRYMAGRCCKVMQRTMQIYSYTSECIQKETQLHAHDLAGQCCKVMQCSMQNLGQRESDLYSSECPKRILVLQQGREILQVSDPTNHVISQSDKANAQCLDPFL